MGSNEKFCLRWNDFESNISVAFREIREEKDFFDCTLSCGSRHIQAHKLILSACSPFFRSILRQNPHQHPLLYLKGVQFTDLQSVLNFIYHGEVNVAQEELNSFLAVAEDLQVKGLTQTNSAPSNTNSNPKSYTTPPSIPKPKPLKDPEPPPSTKRPRPAAPQPIFQSSYQHQEDDIQEVLPTVKTEPQTNPYPASIPAPIEQSLIGDGGIKTMNSMNMQVTNMEESYGDDGYDYGGYEGDGQGYEGDAQEYEEVGMERGTVDQNKGSMDTSSYISIDYGEDGGKTKISSYNCNLCGKAFKKICNAKTHVESVHVSGVQVECRICAKIFKNKDSLKSHFRNKHGRSKEEAY